VPVKEMFLVRHGVTDWNSSGRFQGQTDVPLNAEGLRQAAAAAAVIAGWRPTRLFSSDLARARATAEAVGEACGLPVALDARLREVDVGTWAGLDEAKVVQDDPVAAAAVAAGEDYRCSEVGETATESGARVAAALLEYADAFDDDLIVVVGHGLSLQMAAFLLMGLDYRVFRSFHVQSNCGWMSMDPKFPTWRMAAYNRVAEAFHV
jgi:probable phosphoglycerate mutase